MARQKDLSLHASSYRGGQDLSRPSNHIKIRGEVCHISDADKAARMTFFQIRDNNSNIISMRARSSLPLKINDNIVVSGIFSETGDHSEFFVESISHVNENFKFKTQDSRESPQSLHDEASLWLRSANIRGLMNGTVDLIISSFPHSVHTALSDKAMMSAVGVPEKDAFTISSLWPDFCEVQKTKKNLSLAGISGEKISNLTSFYGKKLHNIARESPWRMTQTKFITFGEADSIARFYKIPSNASERLLHGIPLVLRDITYGYGHCGVTEDVLVDKVSSKLKVPKDSVSSFISNNPSLKIVRCAISGLIFPESLYSSEMAAAGDLAAIMSSRDMDLFTKDEAERAIVMAEKILDVKLDRDGGQFEAALASLTNKVSIITGGPGTGKSSTQNVILKAFQLLGVNNREIFLMAPTGRAAKRLTEASGLRASTIHGFLNKMENSYSGSIHNNIVNPDLVIVDECSMMDIEIFSRLLRSLPETVRLILVGDIDQLPSVGPGQVFRDLVSSNEIPTRRLTKVHRQLAGGGIVTAAHRINHGQSPVAQNIDMPGFEVSECDDGKLQKEILKYVCRLLPAKGYSPISDVQVIAAQRRGDVGVLALNEAIKNELNPDLENTSSVIVAGKRISIGDRVMQNKNDYKKGVCNGETGIISKIDSIDINGKTKVSKITVNFSGNIVQFNGSEANHLTLAYACTVHKMQGCEAGAVVFVAPREHVYMLNRTLFYTAVTRARKHCVVLGDRDIINHAPKVVSDKSRNTFLRKRLSLALDDLGYQRQHDADTHPKKSLAF